MSPTKIISEDAADDCQQSAVDVKSAELPKYVQQVALNELREDESTRTQSLLAFRQWVMKNPDIANVSTGTCVHIKIVLNHRIRFGYDSKW